MENPNDTPRTDEVELALKKGGYDTRVAALQAVLGRSRRIERELNEARADADQLAAVMFKTVHTRDEALAAYLAKRSK